MTFVQAWRADGAGSSTTISVTINPAAGSSLIVWVAYETTVNNNVTINDGVSTFLRVLNSTDAGQGFGFASFITLSTFAGSRTLTVTFPAGRTNRSIRVEEHTGLDTYIGAIGPNAQASPGTGANALTSGNINITDQPARLIAVSANWGAGSPPPTAGTGSNNNGTAFDYGGDYARFTDRRITATGTTAATFTAGVNALHYTAAIAVTEIVDPPAGPVIDTVDTLRNGESATITGTFPDTIDLVTIDGVTQTITSQSGTEIEITVNRGSIAYGVSVDLVVEDEIELTDDAPVSLLPQTGWDYVIVGTPNPDPDVRLTALPDLEVGDQVAWDTVGGDVDVYADLTWDADESVNAFQCEAWDAGDSTWGATATQIVADVYGAGAITFDDVSISGTGASGAQVNGSGAIALSNLILAGSGSAISVGSGAIALDPIAVSGAGVRDVTADGAIELDPVVVSGSAARNVVGNGDIGLESVQVSGAGASGSVVVGLGAITLSSILTSGAGGRSVLGAGNVSLPTINVSGSSERAVSGSGAISLLPIRAAGSGATGGAITGVGDIALSDIDVSGSGVRGAVGSGDISIPDLMLSGSGSVAGSTTGDGAISLSVISISGVGSRSQSSSGAISLVDLDVDGMGAVGGATIGSGSIILGSVSVSGTARREISAAGDVFLPSLTVAGRALNAMYPIDGQAFKNLDAYGSLTVYCNGLGHYFSI